jgi:uncharacterized membrane protein YfcA
VAGAWLSQWAGGTTVLIVTALVIGWASVDMLLQHRAATAAGTVAGEGESDEGLVSPRDVSPVVRNRPLVLATIGILAGVYSGFLGLGGGFLIVPGLTRFLGMPVKRAIGTSLVAVAVLAVPGTISHSLLGHIDWPLAGLLALGVVPGALIGARLTGRASDRLVRLSFAALLAVVGVWLAVSEIVGLRP